MRLSFALLLSVMATPVLAMELLMVEQPGCAYCKRWNAEIAPTYPKTDLGNEAPLRRIDIDNVGKNVQLKRPVIFTPTFLFVEDNIELARMEGYQSEDFFWAVGEEILAQQRQSLESKSE